MSDFSSPTEIDGYGRGVGVKVVIADRVSDSDVGPVIPVVAATVRGAVLLAILSAAVFLFVTGCSGYHIGTNALYTSEIKTVFVPMVEADTYRRGISERLTEAVCKKITERTPFDLASSKDADSVLHIRLVADSQYVSGLDAYNNTRQKNLVWCVTAEWKDRRDATLARLDPTPLTSIGVSINEMEYLVPETGQSTATAQQEMIDKLADRIVGLMEEKW